MTAQKVNKQETNLSKKKIEVIILVVLLVLLGAGLAWYVFIGVKQTETTSQESTNTSQQATISEAEAKREAGEIMSKVKMNMTKDEVIATIGQPHSCSKSNTKAENGATYTMEQCSYGKKNAPGHAQITFLNGKVWGMTYETGTIWTDTNMYESDEASTQN